MRGTGNIPILRLWTVRVTYCELFNAVNVNVNRPTINAQRIGGVSSRVLSEYPRRAMSLHFKYVAFGSPGTRPTTIVSLGTHSSGRVTLILP